MLGVRSGFACVLIKPERRITTSLYTPSMAIVAPAEHIIYQTHIHLTEALATKRMLYSLTVTAALIAPICYLLDLLYAPKHLPNETPLLLPRIPYVGHIIGLLRHGTRYFETTRQVQPRRKWITVSFV